MMVSRTRTSRLVRSSKKGRLAMLLGWMGWISVFSAQLAVTVSPDVTALPALAGLAFPVGAPMLLL